MGSEQWISSYQSVGRPRKLIDMCIQKLFTIGTLKNIWLLWLSTKNGTNREITDFPLGRRKPSLETRKVLLSSVPGFLFTDEVCICVNQDSHYKLMTQRTMLCIQKILEGTDGRMEEQSVLRDISDFENSCFPLQKTLATEDECLDMIQGKGKILFENSWCVVKIFELGKKVRIYGFPQEENTWIYYFDI